MTDQGAETKNPFTETEEIHRNIMNDTLAGDPAYGLPETEAFWKEVQAQHALEEYSRIDDLEIFPKIMQIGRAHNYRYAPQALRTLSGILETAETRLASGSKDHIRGHISLLAIENVDALLRKRETLSPVFEIVDTLKKAEHTEKALAHLYKTVQASVTSTVPATAAQQAENDLIRKHILKTLAEMDTDDSAAAIKAVHFYNHCRNGAGGISILADEILIEKLSSMSTPAAPGVIAHIGAPDFEKEGLTEKTTLALNNLVAYYNAHARGAKTNTPERRAVMQAVIAVAKGTFLDDPARFRTALDGGLINGNTTTYDLARKPSAKTVERLVEAFRALDSTPMFSIRKLSPMMKNIVDEHTKEELRRGTEQEKHQSAIRAMEYDAIW